MEEEMVLKLIGNIGVPAVICLYTLYGVNKTLKELTSAINKQTAEFERRALEHTHEIGELKSKVNELTFRVENLWRREEHE